MGVAQYEAKFTKLSLFAPHLVSTETLRVKKFRKGLNFKIRQRLTTSRVEDYKNLVILAEAVEEDIQERTKMKATLEQNRGKTVYNKKLYILTNENYRILAISNTLAASRKEPVHWNIIGWAAKPNKVLSSMSL